MRIWGSALLLVLLASGCVTSQMPLIAGSPLYSSNDAARTFNGYTIDNGDWKQTDQTYSLTLAGSNEYLFTESPRTVATTSSASEPKHLRFESLGSGFYLVMYGFDHPIDFSTNHNGGFQYVYTIVYKDSRERNVYEWNLYAPGVRDLNTHATIDLTAACAEEYAGSATYRNSSSLSFQAHDPLVAYAQACVRYIQRNRVPPDKRYEATS